MSTTAGEVLKRGHGTDLHGRRGVCGDAAATVARRFGTVATIYSRAVIDGVIPANRAAAVTRPKVAWEGQKRAVLRAISPPRPNAPPNGVSGLPPLAVHLVVSSRGGKCRRQAEQQHGCADKVVTSRNHQRETHVGHQEGDSQRDEEAELSSNDGAHAKTPRVQCR